MKAKTGKANAMKMLQEFSQELVILSGRLIGEKVLITDTDGVIIGCSDAERIGELHEASLNVLQTGISRSHDQNAASGLRGTFAGITLPLEYDGRLVGTVGITGDPATVVQYGQLIQAFVEMMLRYRTGQQQSTLREQECLSLIREIIHYNGTKEEESRILIQADSIGCDLSVRRIVVLVQSELSAEGGSPVETGEMQDAVRRCFDAHQNFCVPLSAQQMLVLAALPASVNESQGAAQIRERCGMLNEQLEAQHIPAVIALGGVASGIGELHVSCGDVQLTARIAQYMTPRPGILSSEDVTLERMISSIPKRVYGAASERAMELIRNQKDAPEMRRLILSWCENGFSISDTSRALYIHKNTLIYRMERIHRLTGLDLHSFRDAMTLYLLISMDRYQEHL